MKNCWDATKGMGHYCQLHIKILRDKSMGLLTSHFNKLGDALWLKFILKLKKNCKPASDNIDQDVFFRFLEGEGLRLGVVEKEFMIETFSLRDIGNQKDLCITKIFELAG